MHINSFYILHRQTGLDRFQNVGLFDFVCVEYGYNIQHKYTMQFNL